MYGTHAAASAFATARGLTGWPAVQADGEALLLRASDALDAAYIWKGVRAERAQVRQWPRINVIDDDGYEVSWSEVPDAVEQATYRLALLLVSNADNLTTDETAKNIQSIQAGSVGITYADRNPNVTPRSLARHCDVSGYLKGLTLGSASNCVLRRV
jgi:hypothetical protein